LSSVGWDYTYNVIGVFKKESPSKNMKWIQVYCALLVIFGKAPKTNGFMAFNKMACSVQSE